MSEIIYQEKIKTVRSSIYVLIRKDIRKLLGITEKNSKDYSYKLVYNPDTKSINIIFLNKKGEIIGKKEKTNK